MIMKYKIYQDETREWRWQFIGGNGENLASGESYKRRAMALKVVNLMKASSDAPIEYVKFEMKEKSKKDV